MIMKVWVSDITHGVDGSDEWSLFTSEESALKDMKVKLQDNFSHEPKVLKLLKQDKIREAMDLCDKLDPYSGHSVRQVNVND